MGSRGEALAAGLGMNPVGGMGNEVPPEAGDIFRLKGIFFTQNK